MQKMAQVSRVANEHVPIKCLLCRLAFDDSLWHFIPVSELAISPTCLEKLLTYHKTVKVLDFAHNDTYKEKDFIRMWPLCTQLIEVSLAFCNITQDALFVLLSSCPNLRWLSLEGCEAINHLPLPTVRDKSSYHIQYLNLAYCVNFNDLGCVTIGCIFGRNLRHLNIDGAQYITDIGLGMILNQCSASQLKFLAIDGAEITNVGIKKLQRFTHLQNILISFCTKLTDSSLSYISTLSSLKEIHFKKGEQFSSTGLQSLFINLSKLVYISLVECWETDDRCLQVISTTCRQLKKLTVTWAKVTNPGVDCIMKHCLLLCELNLTGSYELTEQPFLRLLDTRSGLKLLNLTQCHMMCDRTLRRIKNTTPNLKIIDYYGETI